LRSRLNDQEVVFEVEDTGVGLSPDDCQKVFEIYRVKKDRDMAGHGLAARSSTLQRTYMAGGSGWPASWAAGTFRVSLPGLAQLNA
jgi:sensor histidine kinase regulating citrate/malate metabolism